MKTLRAKREAIMHRNRRLMNKQVIHNQQLKQQQQQQLEYQQQQQQLEYQQQQLEYQQQQQQLEYQQQLNNQQQLIDQQYTSFTYDQNNYQQSNINSQLDNEYQQQINYQQSVNDQLNQITQSTPIEQPINKLQLLKEQRDNETFEIEQMFLLKNKAQNEKSFNEFMNSSHIDLMTSSIDTSIENMLNNTNIQNQ